MSSNQNVFSFRLPMEYMQWFNDHIPQGQDNRHKAMLTLVIQTIQSQPDFKLSSDSPMEQLRKRIVNEVEARLDDRDDSIRRYIRSLIQDNGAGLSAVRSAREVYQTGSMGDEVPDDLIDNILEGL